MYFIEPYMLIHKPVLITKNLTSNSRFKTLAIRHLSDFHFGDCPVRDLKLINKIIALPPADILCMTGDFIENSRGLQALEILLRNSSYPYGGYAVFGNNDGRWRHILSERFARYKITTLLNEMRSVNIDDVIINITGLDDSHLFKEHLPAKVSDNGLNILLAHSSEIYTNRPDRKIDYDIILTGHTHGGQITLPFVGSVFHNTRNGNKWSKGVYNIGSSTLIVNTGIGTTALPLRLFRPPEAITVLIPHINGMR